MKKIHVVFLIILFTLFAYNTFSQVYLRGVAPLKPGNLWKYYDIGWFGAQTNFFVTDSIKTIGSKTYSVVETYEDRNPTRYPLYFGITEDQFYASYDIYSSDSIYKYLKKDCKISDTNYLVTKV